MCIALSFRLQLRIQPHLRPGFTPRPEMPSSLCTRTQVPDELLVERVVGRRLDPQTGAIYHLKYSPPPADIVSRLIQRSDDTEDKVRRPVLGFELWGFGICRMCVCRVIGLV